MELVFSAIEFILHIDRHLAVLIANYGAFTYSILFLIVFSETGFVVTPFLPGDSLLFAAGALASIDLLNVKLVFLLLALAAILGDTVNYWVGHIVGPKVFRQEKGLLFNKHYLKRTHEFYEKYGGKTIVIARFIPIIRTFAPFVAGVGKMSYSRFLSYNVIGGVLWVSIFVFGGYFFGNIPLVKQNFGIIIVFIIIISVAPFIFEFVKRKP